MIEEPHIIHSDIKDPNYWTREEEIESKTRGIKLDLVLRLGLVVVIALGFGLAAWLGS